MHPQNYEKENIDIKEKFQSLKQKHPDRFKNRLKLSWSNWGFGMESLETSLERLKKNGINFIELHGNRYGQDLGYDPVKTDRLIRDMGMKVSGICGMFSAESEFSSSSPAVRQRAVDYMRRNIELGSSVGARYFLVVPGAVGRPQAYDDMEFERSIETLSIVAGELKDADIRGAVEPIRSDEVSFCHTFSDAIKYIEALGNSGVRHINGDVYHMMHMEPHIGRSIMKAEGLLTNLHMADTNRDALGGGSLDLDTIIMALYIIGYNDDDSAFVTPEPLGPGGDPYRAMYGDPDPESLDSLVKKTAGYFRAREEEVLSI